MVGDRRYGAAPFNSMLPARRIVRLREIPVAAISQPVAARRSNKDGRHGAWRQTMARLIAVMEMGERSNALYSPVIPFKIGI